MGELSKQDIPSEWKVFLQQWTLAKNHYGYTLLLIQSFAPMPTGGGKYELDPIADYLMPSLLYVRMVAVLDKALIEYLSIKSLKNAKNKKYKDGLHGRINTLNDQKLLLNFLDLARIRKTRNEIAHQIQTKISWEDLENDLNIIESELQHLEIIGDRPNYKPDFQCMGNTFKLAIKENEKEILFKEWTNEHW